MLRIFKVGTKYLADPYRGWRDGQLIECFPSGTFMSDQIRKHFLIIEDGLDYWSIRGDMEWKSTIASVMEFKKLTSSSDINGKYPWEFGYIENRDRKRDFFVDPKYLFDESLVSQGEFDTIYDKTTASGIIVLGRDPSTWIFHELDQQRRPSEYSSQLGTIAQDGAGSGTGGGFTIGAAGDYTTVALFEADIAAQLTGDLHGLHLNEETAISGNVTFDTDTNGNTLYLTAELGAEHSGSAYGNGARVNFATFNEIIYDETTGGDLDDIEVSKLAFDISGLENIGLHLKDGADAGTWTVNRMLIKGDSNSFNGIISLFDVGPILITNNIVYDITGDEGILFSGNGNVSCYNNTVINCDEGIDIASSGGTTIAKNNLVQASGTSDYANTGNWDTTGTNVSEDATSPDAAYRSKDVHTNSVFLDYANDDFRLDSTGDATNLAILDDGENLYGSGVTEDVQGQDRDDGTPFWIGASHIVAVVGRPLPQRVLGGPFSGPFGGPF